MKTSKAASKAAPPGSRDASGRTGRVASPRRVSRPASPRSRRGAERVGSGDASRRVGKATPVTQKRAASPTTASRDASAATTAKRRAPKPVGFVCPPCGRWIPTEIDGVVLRARRGSPSRFCSPGCRQAAYRRRQAGVAEDIALQPGGGRDRSLKRPAKNTKQSGRKKNA